MAITITGYPLNNTGYTAADARLYTATRTNGVFSSDTHFIVSAITDEALTVAISKGLAWMHISEFEGVAVANMEEAHLKLETANALLSRIDRIVLRINFITNRFEIDTRTGAPSSTPVAPDLQRDSDAYELGIAEVLILPTTVMLSPSNITDTRLNTSVCGIMTDGVTGIPTQTLYDSWYLWFNNLKEDWEEKGEILQNWIDTFKELSEQTFDEWLETVGIKLKEQGDEFQIWINAFKEASTSEFQTWLDQRQSEFDQMHNEQNEWFDGFIDRLGEGEATGLQLQIDSTVNVNDRQDLEILGFVNGNTSIQGNFIIQELADGRVTNTTINTISNEQTTVTEILYDIDRSTVLKTKITTITKTDEAINITEEVT